MPEPQRPEHPGKPPRNVPVSGAIFTVGIV
jgi:hypothetical protein